MLKHRHFVASARWALVLIPLTLALAPTIQAAPCQRTALQIPVKLVNQRPIVTLNLAGEELPMLLDTGAFFSMLLPATAAQLRLQLQPLPYGMRLQGYAGEIEASMTKVPDGDFHGLPLRNVEFIVGGNELGSGIRGIIGRNLLGLTDMEYDLAKGQIRLHMLTGDCQAVNPVYWAGDVPVIESELDIRRGDKALRVPVRINGRRLTALMDTGAPRTALSWASARTAGFSRDALQEVGRVGGAGEGSVTLWRARMARFEFGGQTVTDVDVNVSGAESRDHDLLIGLDYFLSHRIYVSYAQRKLYATWNGGPVFSSGEVDRADDAQRGAAVDTNAPDDPAALERLAAAAATRGDHALALRHLDRAVRLAPDDPAHRVARARVRLAARQSGPALQDLDEALTRAPALHEARLLRAQLRVAQGLRERALDDLGLLDQAWPAAEAHREDLAEHYARLGLLPEAVRQWDLWLAPRPNDNARGEVLNARCWLRARLGQQLDDALKDCEAAVRHDPRMPAFHDSLGWLQLRRGQPALALKSFDKALSLSEKSAWSWLGRGLAHRRLGDAAAAALNFERARALRPDIEAAAAGDGFGGL
jgi:clan AA aspartic protease (TIGR02281 family)